MLFAPETWPFTAATLLMLLITLVEGIALLIGTQASSFVDHLLPDPWDGIDGPFDKGLGWLHVGRVPALVLLVIFLASFALTGFALNLVVHRMFGIWVPVWIGVPVAVVAALPMVRILGAGLARVLPQDETYAVTFDSLIGRVATVIAGNARRGYPAQAKVASQHGQTLYVMVEPDEDGITFAGGSSVLLVRQISGNRFAAINNPRPDLL